jgi:hypothetical protein
VKEETEWEILEDDETLEDEETVEDEATEDSQPTCRPGSWIPELLRAAREYYFRLTDY